MQEKIFSDLMEDSKRLGKWMKMPRHLAEQRRKGLFCRFRRLDESEWMIFLLVRKDSACLVLSVLCAYIFYNTDKKYGRMRMSCLSDGNTFLENHIFQERCPRGRIHAILGPPDYQNDNFIGWVVGWLGTGDECFGGFAIRLGLFLINSIFPSIPF